jgi:YVTN family beta-propeller protein
MGKQGVLSAAIWCALVTGVGAEERQRLLVTHEEEGVVTFLDPTSGEALGKVRVGFGPHEIVVSPDGRRAVTTNYGLAQGGSSLSLVDVEGQRLLRTIPLTLEVHQPDLGRVTHTFHRPHGICFTRNPTRVLVTCESEQALLLVDVEEGRVLAAIDTDQELSRQVLLDHGGRRAFVSNQASGSISVIDLRRRRLVEVLATGGGAQGMALHPVKDELWVANFETNSISVIDTKTLEETWEFPCGTCPVRLAFTADGARILCVNHGGGSISVFDTESRHLVREIGLAKLDDEQAAARPLEPEQQGFGRSALPVSLCLSPDGGTAWVTCGRSDRVAELDVAALEVRRYLETRAREPLGLAWASFEDDVARAK